MRARPGLVWIPQHFGALLFDRRRSRYLPFDHAASALLRDLAERGAGPVLAADPAHAAFVADLDARGYLTGRGHLDAEVLDPGPLPADHLLGPLAVHLEVMGACNLTCGHCFAMPLPRHKDPLTLAELDVLFAELAALGSLRLGLTGGEPLLRPDLLEVLDLATDHGLHPCLTTNALLLTEDLARQLGRRPLVWLNVSLEGASAETNDPVRGAGTFEAVRDKLRLLGRHARFTLAFTLTRQNLHEVEACAALAAEVGADTAVFRPLYPTGAALQQPGWMPGYDEYADALQRLVDWAGPRRGGPQAGWIASRDAPGLEPPSPTPPPVDWRGLDPFGPESRAGGAARVHANEACGAGTLVCSISVSGDVNPCSFLGPEQVCGNVREAPFRELWSRSEGMHRIRALSAAPREPDAPPRFAGGCRARSLAAHGDLDAPDPWEAAWRARGGGGVPPLGNVHLEGDAAAAAAVAAHAPGAPAAPEGDAADPEAPR